MEGCKGIAGSTRFIGGIKIEQKREESTGAAVHRSDHSASNGICHEPSVGTHLEPSTCPWDMKDKGGTGYGSQYNVENLLSAHYYGDPHAHLGLQCRWIEG